jgi:hypothetical protein
MKGIRSIDLIDFYDYDSLEKLQETRARKWLKLYLKAKNGEKKAVEAIRKHEEEDREIKKRARESGYYWV